MRANPFYFEIKDVMTQFVGAFNDIIINRHDRERDVRSKIQVRYVYAPKQRVVHDLTNKARHLTLPVVAVNIGGISRDVERVFNKIEGSFFPGAPIGDQQLSPKSYHVPQPVPIDVTVNMSILARYQTDVEQIISNFVPYSDPYIVISWKMPETATYKEQEIRSEVMWSGDLSMNYPDQLSSTEPYRLSCDTTFTIKTWLFKKFPDPSNNIVKITTTMTPESGPLEDINTGKTGREVNGSQPNTFSFSLPFYDDLTERSYVESFGPPLTAAPFITHVFDSKLTTEVLGYNFSETTSVYLSSTTLNQLSGQHVDVYPNQQNTHLNTLYPAFTGVPVEYSVTNDNKLSFNKPVSADSEEVDIIITNAGGYDTSMNSTLNGKGIFLM